MRKFGVNDTTLSLDTLKNILNSAPIGFVVFDNTGLVTLVNQTFMDLTGYSFADADNLNRWRELAYPDEKYRNAVAENFNKLFGSSEVKPITTKVRCKNGTYKYFEIGYVCIDGHHTASFTDVTERELNSQKVSEFSYKQDLLLQLNLDFIAADLKQIHKHIQRLIEFLGSATKSDRAFFMHIDFESKSLNYKNYWDASGRDSKSSEKQLINFTNQDRIKHIQNLLTEEVLLISPANLDANDSLLGILEALETKSFLVSKVVKFGKTYGIIGLSSLKSTSHFGDFEKKLIRQAALIISNAMERGETQDHIGKHEGELQFLFDNMAQGVIYMDAGLKVTKINHAAELILGIDREQLEGRKVTKLNWSSYERDGENYKLNDLPFTRAIKEGEVCEQEIMGVYNPKKKAMVWLQVDVKPVFTKGKKQPSEVFVTFTDITKMITYQGAINRANQLLEKTGETALVASFEYLVQENKLTWSDVAYKIHEIPKNYNIDLTSAIGFYAEGESRRKITSAVADAIVTGEPFDVTCEIISAKGNHKWLRVIGIPERKNGVTVSVFGTAQDITMLEQQRTIIKDEQERMSSIVAHAGIGTWEWDNDHQEMVINDYFASMLGYKKEELVPLIGAKMASITHPDDLPMVTRLFDRCMRGEIQTMENEVRLKHKDGSWVWVLNKASLILKDGEENAVKMFGVHIDLSGVKKAEEDLKLSEQRFKLIADNVDEIFWLRNADNTQVYYVNPAYERVYGHSTDTLIKRPESFIDSIYKEDLQLFYDAYESYKVTGVFDVDFRIVRADGEIRWLNSKSMPVYDEHGKIAFHTGIATDITKQKLIENQLRASEQRFRKLFTENASPMLLINPLSGQVVDVNPASEKFYGWKKEAFLRKFAPELCYFADGEIPTEPWWADTKRKYTTLTQKMADGTIKALEVYYSSIEMNDEQLVFAIVHDISEKRAYLEAIEQQNVVLKDIAWTQSHMVRAPLSNIMGLMNLLSLERNVQANPNGFTISSEVYDALVKSAMQMDKALREVSQKTNIVDELKSRLN